MPTNVLRIVDQVDRATARRERETVRALRAYIEEAHRRLKREVQVAYKAALVDVRGQGRTFREARAAAMLQQVESALAALDLSNPGSGVPDAMRDVIVLQRQEGAANVAATLDAVDDTPIAAALTTVNLAAAEMQVANSARRLARYSRATVDGINAAVTDGLIRGAGVQEVQREIARRVLAPADLRAGDRVKRTALGGLAARAETIARTEMIAALEDAREDAMRDADVTMALWTATDDERTCPYCAARDGNVYRLKDLVLPAHPRCRCVTSPVRPEWLDDGAIDVEAVREHQEDTRRIYADAHGKDARYSTGPSPFEKAAGMIAKPQPVWTAMGGWR